MISDRDLVLACQASYHLAPTLPVPPTGTDVRITFVENAAVVAFRGSVTAEDWARDFMIAPIVERDHADLGPCHAGFLDGAESVKDAVLAAAAGKNLILTGHSLGGALALAVGALLIGTRAVQSIATFGAPRVGMDKFVHCLLGVPIRQYRRGNDPVPTVPFDVPPWLRFLDARQPLIAVGVAQRDPFACHSIDGYVVDVGAYLAAPVKGAA